MNKPTRTFLRILGMTLAVLVALTLACYLLLVAINLKDDDLAPAVGALLGVKPPAIPDNDNGYFAWIGVLGPASAEPHAWGRRWLAEALAGDKAALATMSAPELGIAKEKRKEALELKDIPCNTVENCIELTIANLAAARSIVAMGQLTLTRGDQALAHADYREPWRPDYSFASPLPYQPAAWRPLCATRFALAVAEGRHDEALEQLGREIGFHTRQVQGSVSMLDKMLGFANLNTRYSLLGQYLRHYPEAAGRHAERIARLLAALPAPATSLAPSLQAEQRMLAAWMLSLRESMAHGQLLGTTGLDNGLAGALASNVLGRPLLLPNASANTAVAALNPWLKAEESGGDAYRQALAEARASLPKEEANFTLRNPVGQLFNAIALPNVDGYFLRRDNLLALRALVAFQLKLRQEAVAEPEAIAQAVQANQEALRHPYSGAIPVYDKAKRRLAFPAGPGGTGKVVAIDF